MASDKSTNTPESRTEPIDRLVSILIELEKIESEHWESLDDGTNDALQHACDVAGSVIERFVAIAKIEQSGAITGASDSAPRQRFTVLVDPPDCNWEQSSDGLIFSPQATAKFLSAQEIWDSENPETFLNLMRMMQPYLLLITSQLTECMGHFEEEKLVMAALHKMPKDGAS